MEISFMLLVRRHIQFSSLQWKFKVLPRKLGSSEVAPRIRECAEHQNAHSRV